MDISPLLKRLVSFKRNGNDEQSGIVMGGVVLNDDLYLLVSTNKELLPIPVSSPEFTIKVET